MADDSEKYKRITVKLDALEGETIAKADAYLRKFTTVIKNLSDAGEAFTTQARKYSDSITKDYYVRSDRANQAMRGFNAVQKSLIHSESPTDPASNIINPVSDIQETDVAMQTFTKKVMGNVRKLAEIKRYIVAHGGSMTALPSDNMYSITVPNVPIGVSGAGNQITLATSIKKTINDHNSYLNRLARASSTEKANEEAAKVSRAHVAKANAEDEKADAIQSRIDRMHSKEQEANRKRMMGKIMGGWKPEDDDEKGNRIYDDVLWQSMRNGNSRESSFAKKALGVKDEDESGSSDKFGGIKSIAHLATIVFVLKQIFDLVKTLALGAASAANNAVKDTVTGLGVGLSAFRVMQYNAGDSAKGMPENTTVGAISDINSKFSNIANIKESDITTIALLLGDEVKDFILSGSGGDLNPEQLNDKLLKAMIERVLSGKNMYGTDVGGVSNAMRVMASNMQGFSPNVVTEFVRRMQDVLDSSLPAADRERAKTGTQFDFLRGGNAALTNPAGLTGVDLAALKGFDRLADELASLVKEMKNGWFAKMALDVGGILSFIRVLARAGMGDEEKAIDRERARADSEARLPVIEELSGYANEEYASAFAYLSKYKGENGKAKYSEIDVRNAYLGIGLPTAMAGASDAEVAAFNDAVSAVALQFSVESAKKSLEKNIASDDPAYLMISAESVYATAKQDAQRGLKKSLATSNMNSVAFAQSLVNDPINGRDRRKLDAWLDASDEGRPETEKLYARQARNVRLATMDSLQRFQSKQALSTYLAENPTATAANKHIVLTVEDSTQTIVIKSDKTGETLYTGRVSSSLGGKSVTFDADTLDVVRNVPAAAANAFSGNTSVYDATKKFK